MGNIFTNKKNSSTKMENSRDTIQQPIHSKLGKTHHSTSIDEKNKDALKVLKEQGDSAFVSHVFTGDNGKALTYSEMRDRYG